MPATVTIERDPMQIPAFWSRLLWFVGLGKAAIAGAGLALAVLGALDIAFAITAQEFMREIRPVYLDMAAAGGGVLGATARILLR